jgi:hypothetical protein
MSGPNLISILDRVFRSSPAFELVPFDRLPAGQQQALRGLTNDPEFYGVLLPHGAGGRSIKSVSRDTAVLLNSLMEPGPLPSFVREGMGESSDRGPNRAVAEMVLDGILEIEQQGEFVSGVGAYSTIYVEAASGAQGLLAGLSQAALEYAQALELDEVTSLSARLYFYNRLPCTRRWTKLLSSKDAVAKFLGISDPACSRFLERSWVLSSPSPGAHGWLQWRTRRNLVRNPDRPTYKLYVSPQPEELPEIFRTVVGILEHSEAHHFKTGCDASGLLRPDKFVLYFDDSEALEQTALEIGRRVKGCAAQGVPFTAALSEDGLLSWGIDPVPQKGAVWWQQIESWRQWITDRLAVSLIAARSVGAGPLQPWQFALERLRLDDVDTSTWIPGRYEAASV